MANLYVLPNDLYDYLGVNGAQLRLDDTGAASGQTVTCTANAALGATSLQIAPLSFPLLNGTTLTFGGSAMANTLDVILSAAAKTGDTTLTVNALGAPVNLNSTAQDNGVNLATAVRLTKACQYGTSQVQLYCLSRYDDSQLFANSQNRGSVSRWATALAGRWLGRRRAQGAPKGIEEDADESLEELRAVRTNGLNIDGIGTRTSGWPFWSDTTIDLRYTYAKVRAQPITSEQTPTIYGQFVDWNSIYYLGYI